MIRRSETPVLVFALLVALLAVASAYFADRNGDIDELGLYNPSYMLARYGKLTYPIHGYFDAPVIVHPPVHVGLIGLFARMGFTWYYAEATPTLLLLLLSIVVIVRSVFPQAVKLGLLFSAGFLVHTGERIAVLFGTRPEGEVHAAWFAGLVLLESGRLAGWSRGRLFAGAFLLTWAAGVHYYAAAALAGVAVYAVWAVRDLGWKDARSRVLALCGGGCLFGIPYLVLFIIPHREAIFMALGANRAGAGSAAAVRAHFEIYRGWAHNGVLPWLVRGPVSLGLPLALLATAVLAAVRSTRGIALAALPLEVFVFFFAGHKQPCYLIHEVALFAAAVCIGLVMLAGRLASRLGNRWSAGIPAAAAVVLLGGYLLTGNAALASARFSLEPRVHEAELARAATRDLVGPHARVVSRLAVWYSSGAEHWHSVADLLLDSGSYDLRTYLGNFDAAADYRHFSAETRRPDRATISSLYADGTLKLRGFFFAELNQQLRFVLLSPRNGERVAGYAARNGQLYRFDEEPGGEYSVLAAACPSMAEATARPASSGVFASVLHLPVKAPGDPAELVTVLAPRAEPLHSIRSACRQIAEVHGRMRLADGKALMNSLRRGDVPIHFCRKLEEVPGFAAGVPPALVPPQDTVRLGGVLDLSAIQLAYEKARIEKTPRLRVITSAPPPLGAFAAHIPVTHGDAVAGPCWVALRLRVTAGRIGFAAWTPGKGILKSTEAHLSISAEPVDVALALPNLLETRYITIFNASDDSASQVEVLDAAVLVTRAEWDRRRDVLSKVR